MPQILKQLEKKSTQAKSILKCHVLLTIKKVIHTKMDHVTSNLVAMDEEIQEENLLRITLEDMVSRLKPVAGTLWEILISSTTRKGKLRNKHAHNPQKVCDVA